VSAITRLLCLLAMIQLPAEFAYRPMASWVGQRFVFLPRPQASLAGTYEDFVGTVVCRRYAGRVGDAIGFVKVKKYAPVKVVEVLPGWDEEKPARFVLETAAGERGFLDVNLSGTNVPKELRHLYRFEHRFLPADPRLTHGWPPRVWAAIENNQVLAGMTAEQVRLSWGEPNQVNGDEWSYDGGVLRFRQGVLVAVK